MRRPPRNKLNDNWWLFVFNFIFTRCCMAPKTKRKTSKINDRWRQQPYNKSLEKKLSFRIISRHRPKQMNSPCMTLRLCTYVWYFLSLFVLSERKNGYLDQTSKKIVRTQQIGVVDLPHLRFVIWMKWTINAPCSVCHSQMLTARSKFMWIERRSKINSKLFTFDQILINRLPLYNAQSTRTHAVSARSEFQNYK